MSISEVSCSTPLERQLINMRYLESIVSDPAPACIKGLRFFEQAVARHNSPTLYQWSLRYDRKHGSWLVEC